ncbi:MAG: hypothetical protein ABSD20_02400 [Terriglobales bacterium]|jgi:hypothetical protein
MQRISSGSVAVGKVVFPVIWFGILAIIFLIGLFGKDAHGNHSLAAIVFPFFMAAIGYFIMKKTMWGLADEVLDAGDSLIVRIGREQEQIPLANIINVGYQFQTESARVTLTLRIPSRFGNEISFYAQQKFLRFAPDPAITDLIQRIDAARQAAR